MVRRKVGALGFVFVSFAIFAPVFVGIRGGSFVFDINVFNPGDFPALPLSVIVIVVLSPWVWRRISKGDVILITASLLGGAFVFVSGMYRGLSYALAVICALCSYRIARLMANRCYNKDLVSILFWVCALLVAIKFFADWFVFGRAITGSFLISHLRIYNFYDYYPFVFLLLALGSVVTTGLQSLLLFGLSLLVVFSDSRFFIGSVFLFYLIYYSGGKKLSPGVIACVAGLIIFVGTLVAVVVPQMAFDGSLSERFSHWRIFLGSLTVGDLFFPAFNEYRQSVRYGSFHHELMDLFSYYGVLAGVFLIFIFLGFVKVQRRYRGASLSFFLVLSTGVLVQNNFSHLWSSVILFYVLGIFSEREYDVVERN